MESLDGAFSVTGLTGDGDFFAFKDPHGIKPLCAGHDPAGATLAFCSETVGLDMNSFVRDFELNPGELVTVSKDGFKRIQIIEKPRQAFCSFEYAYFARPDSRFDGKYVYEIREDFGRNIVHEFPEIVRDGDIIMSVPETGDDPAMGVHEASGLRWERASRRHRYVTERAFILLNTERFSTIDKKINILGSKVDGKRVIITEDSIVRGDTTKIIIDKLRKAGATKVYVFVTFPRIIGPCFYGIDMSTYGQLIGSKHSTEEIAKIIGADAVCYQSIEALIKATGQTENELCMACITGKYPTPCAQKMADAMKKKFLEGYEEKSRIYETEELPAKKAVNNQAYRLEFTRCNLMEKIGVLVVSYGAREVAMVDALLQSTRYQVELYVADKQRNPYNAEKAVKTRGYPKPRCCKKSQVRRSKQRQNRLRPSWVRKTHN